MKVSGTLSILAVLAIASIGTALASQGWKSRSPSFDSLLDIDGAHELVLHKQLPDRSVLNSFAVYNPPGAAWLMVPGVVLFTDPRLFGYVGSITLYVGTLIGILLLTRTFFGIRCATLAVALYGLSELGLHVADSLWQRFPLHFFYVWMVYWTVQWVTQRNTKYLAAALLSWAAGMYVFLEIAPALFILPAVWYFYRPPLRIRPLLFVGMLILAIWYPYLRFESQRSFVDLSSPVRRQSNLPANFKASWCNPALTLVDLENPSGISTEPDQGRSVTESTGRKVLNRLLPLWGRGHLAVAALSSNFEESSHIPGISVVLTVLLLIGLFALSVSGISTRTIEITGRHCRYWLPRFAAGMIVVGALWNEFIIAHYISPHGFLQASTISSIRWLQAILVVGGITLLVLRRRVGAIVHVIVNRLSVSADVSVQTKQHPADARLLVLSLLVPWLILMALIEGTTHLERIWWVWPLQVVVLAALATQVSWRSRMFGPVVWIGSVLLVFALSANSFVLSRVEAWSKDGWAGTDSEEVQVVDYVASRLEGRDRSAIGYQVFIWRFMAIFNTVDPRYKVGADFDLLFKDRRGILNTDRCGEGISSEDEFRIVQIKPPWTNPLGKGYFDIPNDKGFRLLRQFGSYQVFQRDAAITSTAGQ